MPKTLQIPKKPENFHPPKVEKAFSILTQSEMLTEENKAAVTLCPEHADSVAEVICFLTTNRFLTDLTLAAIVKNAPYAEGIYAAFHLLKMKAEILTDENIANLFKFAKYAQTIADELVQAQQDRTFVMARPKQAQKTLDSLLLNLSLNAVLLEIECGSTHRSQSSLSVYLGVHKTGFFTKRKVGNHPLVDANKDTHKDILRNVLGFLK